MPELCRFHGIVIAMYSREHGPPHFHARHGGDYASVAIDHPAMLRGRLPPRATALVIEWAVLRQAELREAWARVQRGESPGRIPPLD